MAQANGLRVWVASCAIAAAAWPGQAGAQDARPGEPSSSANPGQASNAPSAGEAGEGGDAGDIIVTATRESTLLSRTPVAVTAITGAGLREAGITNPTQLTDTVPNVQITRGNGLQVTIRGVTSTDGTEKGDPSVAFLQDGVYIARPQQQEVSFYDLERVEVLRGPQGTLYGRNTTAGVLHLISARPQYEFGGSVDVSYGNFEAINAVGVLNVPAGEAVALRAAVVLDRRDSFIRLPAGSPFAISPYKDNVSGRLSALFDVTPNLQILLRADYSELGGRTPNGVPTRNFFPSAQRTPPPMNTEPPYVDIGSSEDKRSTTFLPPWSPNRDNNSWGVMGQLDWDLGPVAITYIGSHRESETHERGSHNGGIPNPATPTALPTLTFDGAYEQDSHELRLAFGRGGRLHGQVGGYYFHERSGIALFLQNFPLGGPGTEYGFPQDPTIAESKAAFGQLTFDITPDLHLTGGIRYSEDDKSRVGQTMVRRISDRTPILVLQNNNAARVFDKVTWRVGLDYDVPELGLVYASVATGYKAGGFNDGCETGVPACPAGTPGAVIGLLYYDPETLVAYEGGVKFRLLDDALRLNIAAFHYDYNGLQLSASGEFCGPGTQCQRTTNAAKAKVDGIELEPTIFLDENNRINLSFNYLNARYTEFFPSPTVNWEGKKLDRSPEVTAAAGYTHTQPLANGGELEFAGVIRFSDSYVMSDTANRLQFRQPSFHKSDLTVTYRSPDALWYAQAFVKNIEDEIVVTSVAAGTFGLASFADPRLFGVRGGFQF